MVWAETAIGALLSASLQVLFDRLASHQLLEFFRSREFDETLLHRLKITLLSVHAVLSDAEEKQIANPIVKEWVDELKDAAYHAEDFLDEISSMASQCNLEAESPRTKKEVQTSISSSISRLKDITSRLEHIAKSKDVLGLKESLGVKPSPRLPSTSLVDESEVYGRDNDKGEIKQLLLSDSPNGPEIPVIAVVGTGGVGKTTLAQLLFNDPEMEEHFPTRVWVYVSEEFDVLKVTKTIFESVTSNLHCKITDLNLIQVKLKEKLAGKRFLLVLDDVWNENFMNWDILQKPFRDGDSGSRIIVTTRSQSVASIMHAVLIHPLQPLCDEDCLAVFEKYAFRSENIDGHQSLKSIGKEIVKKCKGLPLAAKTLGSLLYSKGETHEWSKILKSKIWDLPIDKSDILPSLRLSYYYLPSCLKQCFAYCSIFPKGYAFEKEKLVLLWMAEGFLLQSRSEKRMEELGHEYFDELLSRSFFQRLSGNKSRFIMHDLINEVAQFASGEFCFKFDGGKPSHAISAKARHFSYARDQIDAIENFEALHELKFLRTFLPLSFSSNPGGALSLNQMVIEDLVLTMKCLRVLSLCHYEISELPDTFTNLKHLRYLDLSRTKMKKLPQSICFLYNLQTLLLSSCFNLIELPDNMRNLIKLVHLDVSGTKLKEMPPDFGKLKNLQTLSAFVVSNRSKISELGELPNLHGKLSILELQNVSKAADAEAAKLKDKKNIKELVFSWNISSLNDLQNETAVLEKLHPHENIERLTIEKYGGTKLPDWLANSYSNVVFLRLTDCKNCTSLPSLGQISSLKKLHIANMERLERIGPEFYSNGSTSIIPFKSLQSLHFDEMPNWKQWTSFAVEGREFPSLQELHIQNCQKLAGNLPMYLPSLTLLHIDECKGLEFLVDDLKGYAELRTLHIIGCDSLEDFPLCFFNKLEYLQIQKCSKLKYIVVSNDLHQVQELNFLGDLEITDCSNLECFSGTGLLAPNLTSLSVSNCRSLKFLPESMHKLLTSLETLRLSCCPKLESFQNGGLPPKLKSLFIMNCDLLTPQKNWGLNKMESLTSVTITGGCSDVKTFPEEGLLPASLIFLQVSEFPELKILDLRGLQLLTSLKTLLINSCASLQCMSEGMLPSSLSNLIINECPLLKPRCQAEQGEYWTKINHIPNFRIYD